LGNGENLQWGILGGNSALECWGIAKQTGPSPDISPALIEASVPEDFTSIIEISVFFTGI